MTLHSDSRNDSLDEWALFACPLSGAPLQSVADALVTSDSDVRYIINKGIPNFLRFGSAEDATTCARLDRLVQIAENEGWQEALRALHGSSDWMMRYVTDPARSSFCDLLPLADDKRVLEIGPGLGQFTSILAQRSKSVHALEVVGQQAAFVAERSRQMGASNVYVATGGDDCRLPYRDGSFDIVVLNLVFEWCASRCIEEDPIEVQARMLRSIARVLKPGGTLYLSTKNRYALRYLIGKVDEHCWDMPFGSALPRVLLNILLRLIGKARAPGLLHSHNALSEMLCGAGFVHLDSYWATPEMRNPTQYVGTSVTDIRSARRDPRFVEGEFRSTRLLMPLIPSRLVRYVTPGLTFVARKAGA